MKQRIIQAVQAVLPDARVAVSTPDGTHYQAEVVSGAFADMPLIEQHRLVMNALREEFRSDDLHALQLKTSTPRV